ncbi:LuxR C-terminal-related transcriptional regulator [Amycolatopsis taiwanensis]|uniref:Helix-turn-helix transcriptional regulator n=1 Tax=Amycolatopsis taiwanensis TaxID=342230 RepID=A0A9W6VG21_9PSEU|nr:LuxR C-terminal-related transcriptional regulator [Amycolatopsis taiwanensis]GLY65061.1 helix-turn-helix transcriptional regulator [Amycolatopsis taiwanensis]
MSQTNQLVTGDEAGELAASVAADPLAPVRAAIRAPGGYGKSTLLAELRSCFRHAGVPVLNVEEALADAPRSREAVILVDDAHRLPGGHLERLVDLAVDEQARLIVAYRPWPASPALTELAGILERTHPAVLLRPLDRAGIVGRAAALLGDVLPEGEPPAGLVELLDEQTGGVQRYVDRVLRAVRQAQLGTRLKAPFQVPQAAVTQFQPELDRLDPEVYRLLLGKAVAPGLDTELLTALLGLDVDTAWELMDGARATGMLDRGGALLPIAQRAITALSPAERRLSVQRQLIEAQRARGGPVLALVRPLLGTGAGGRSIAAAFEQAGDEALAESPHLAAELYAAAIAAGAPAAVLAGRRAQAAGLSGDFDTALRLADGVVAGADEADRAQAAKVAGMVLAHRGLLGPSAELYRWSGSASAAAFAVIGLLGTGQLAEAERMLAEGRHSGPPVLATSAAAQMARGVYQSVTDGAATALATLTRASSMLEPVGQAELLPDTPAALAALVALHCGEFVVADSVLARAISAKMGGTLAVRRHRLLQAWGAMLRGETVAAREKLAEASGTPGALEPRDALVAAALRVGIARRESDLGALRDAWEQAREAAVRHPADLFSLLPLGELAVAAARLGGQDRLAPHLAEAEALLDQLGNPPLWEASLRWNRMHAAIVSEQLDEAEPHAAALTAVADGHPYFAVLAAAARGWLNVLTGNIDPGEVEAAARGLHGAGLSWDGPRLAGQAAIRTADRKGMLRLLDCARTLGGKTARPSGEGPSRGDQRDTLHTEPPRGSVHTLSEREREVAELVVDGFTYKEIGQRLFISAKTVEYHVARMRQRFGCSSRSDLLAHLRLLVGPRPAS